MPRLSCLRTRNDATDADQSAKSSKVRYCAVLVGINPKQPTAAVGVHRRQGSGIVSCRLALLSLKVAFGHVTSIANSTYGGTL
jgi:hypothetical protein